VLRFATPVLLAFAVVSAATLYAVNYRTRGLNHDLKQAHRQLEALDEEIATLRAERAFLARPDRIAKEARALGMGPASGTQFMRAPTRQGDQ